MAEYCLNTPSLLNMKLRRFKPSHLEEKEANKIYNDLSDSIPILNSQFSFLKNKSKSLNKIFNENKIIYNDTSILNRNYPSTNIYQNFLCGTDTMPFSKNKSVFSINKNKKLNEEKVIFTNYSHKNCINNSHPLKNSHAIPFLNDNNYGGFNNNKDSLDNYYIMSNNFKNNTEFYNSSNNIFKNSNDNDYYSEKNINLNNCIQQKDEVINELQVLIKKTMDKLIKKQEENNLLQTEISELKKNTENKKNNEVFCSPLHNNKSCDCSCNCSKNYQQPSCSKYKKNCEYCKYLEEEIKPSDFEYAKKNKFEQKLNKNE